MPKKSKVEKTIKKHLKGKVLLGVIIGLIIGLLIGGGSYYLLSNNQTPEFYLLGDNIVYLNVGDEYVDPLYVAKKGDKEIEVIVNTDLNLEEPGEYIVTYQIYDMSVLSQKAYDITLTRVIIVRGAN